MKEDFITFPWLPSWFQWSPSKEEGMTLDRVIIRSNGRPQKIKGIDHMPWYTSKSNPRPQIHFNVDGKLIHLHKYELIWMAHHWQPIPDGCVIHHIDFNHQNNEISNLQLMTALEHKKLHAKTNKCCQKNNYRSKAVVGLDERGNIVHRFASTREARRHGFSQSHVSAACRGCYLREGNHYFKGYYWWYEQEWLELQ